MSQMWRSPLTTHLVGQNQHTRIFQVRGQTVYVAIKSWGEKVTPIVVNDQYIKVLILHKTVYLGKKPFPGAKGNVEKLIKLPKYAQYDLIISGDNHKQFEYRHGKTLWLNCGCLFRTKASEKYYVPTYWKLYFDENHRVTIKAVNASPLGDKCFDVVSAKHLDMQKREKEWDSAFAKKLQEDLKNARKDMRPQSFAEKCIAHSASYDKKVKLSVKEFLGV